MAEDYQAQSHIDIPSNAEPLLYGQMQSKSILQ